MVAALNQNFTIYIGDSAAPVFTVTGGPPNNAPIDISGATEIIWVAARSPGGTPILTKRKTTAGIAFVNTGTDGKFKVIITAADSALLSGSYVHSSVVTDGTGAVSTVALGAMQVGAAPSFTYDATALSGTTAYSKLMQVRTLIADTNNKDALLWDEQINFAVAQRINIYSAAADCCRQIAAKYSRDVDITEGLLHKSYSARQRAFAARAEELDQRARIAGSGLPYAGGISRMDKQLQNQNSDRVVPQFMIGLTDAWLPVGPVDNELGLNDRGPRF